MVDRYRKRPPLPPPPPDRFDLTELEKAGVEAVFDELEKAHVPVERHRRLWRSAAWSFDELVHELEAIIRRVLPLRAANILERLEKIRPIEPDVQRERSVPEDEASSRFPSGTEGDFGI